MGAEDNAPLVGAAEPGPIAEGDEVGPPAPRRRSLGLIFSLVVIAALLIVAALLVRTQSRVVTHPGDPHPRPIPGGAGAAPGVARTPGP